MAQKLGFGIVKPEIFGRAFLAETWRLNLERKIMQAGMHFKPYFYIGLYFYFTIISMIITYIILVLPYINQQILPYKHSVASLLLFVYSLIFVILFLLVLLALAWFFFQYVLDLKIYKRTKAAEDVLEDYLRFLSENLRGGMNFEKSLWLTIKPEFGVLAEEMELVTKKVITGTTLDDAIKEFTQKYDSPMIKRSFDIISEALKGGGSISQIIEDLVENLSSMKELKQELVTTNMSYTIFINAVVLFITPFLFSLSTQFVLVLNRIGSKVGSATAKAGSAVGGLNTFNFSGASIELDEFKRFAILVLVINSIGAALLTAIINKGDWKHGGSSYIAYPIISGSLYWLLTFFASKFFVALVPL